MGSVRTIYFDYNATTPLDPGVRQAMLPFLGELFGNPSSVHHIGRRARVLLDEFRERGARRLRCKPSELVFTSGGTESNNLAVFGAARLRRDRGRHLVTSAIEHHAVLHAMEHLERREGFRLTRLGVDSKGRTDPDELLAALTPETVLVSVQAANNEIGTVQPVQEIGRRCRARGILFHTDAVQWAGKLPLAGVHDLEADMVSLCSHKFHGPKGAGALWIRSPLQPEPILLGGAHENERRAGTENLAGIAGFTEGLERLTDPPAFPESRLWDLTRRLEQAIKALAPEGVHLRSPEEGRLPNTVAFTVERADAMSLLAALDLEGICASSGAACSAGSLTPSHVILALGAGEGAAQSLVRFSLGRETTDEEVTRVCSLLPGLLRRVQHPVEDAHGR